MQDGYKYYKYSPSIDCLQEYYHTEVFMSLSYCGYFIDWCQMFLGNLTVLSKIPSYFVII